jgi:hypothetical protein
MGCMLHSDHWHCRGKVPVPTSAPSGSNATNESTVDINTSTKSTSLVNDANEMKGQLGLVVVVVGFLVAD